MELKEAIEHLKDQCIFGLSRLFTENDILAINIVLEELNNRIPRKAIEDKIEECENRQFSDFTNEPNFAVEKVLKELLSKE